MPKSGIKSSLPPIIWDADQHALTWALLNELEKKENFKILFGKRDSKEVSWHLLGITPHNTPCLYSY